MAGLLDGNVAIITGAVGGVYFQVLYKYKYNIYTYAVLGF